MRSPPSRGAWIEIAWVEFLEVMKDSSPPSRGAWIEIVYFPVEMPRDHKSPPSRGAWIEILKASRPPAAFNVAPLAGGVD